MKTNKRKVSIVTNIENSANDPIEIDFDGTVEQIAEMMELELEVVKHLIQNNQLT